MPDFNETSKLTTHAYSVLMWLINPTAVAQTFVDSSPRLKDKSRERYPHSSREEVYIRRRGRSQKDHPPSPQPAIVYAPSVPNGHTPSERSAGSEKQYVKFAEGMLHNALNSSASV